MPGGGLGHRRLLRARISFYDGSRCDARGRRASAPADAQLIRRPSRLSGSSCRRLRLPRWPCWSPVSTANPGQRRRPLSLVRRIRRRHGRRIKLLFPHARSMPGRGQRPRRLLPGKSVFSPARPRVSAGALRRGPRIDRCAPGHRRPIGTPPPRRSVAHHRLEQARPKCIILPGVILLPVSGWLSSCREDAMTVPSVRTVLAATWIAAHPGRGAGAIPAAAPAGTPRADGARPLARARHAAAGRSCAAAIAGAAGGAEAPAGARPGGPWIADEEPLPPNRPQKPAAAPPAPPTWSPATACSPRTPTHLKLAIKYDSRNVTLRPGGRSGGHQDQRLHPVSERSQAPAGGGLDQRCRAQRHVGDRDQRQIAMGRAEGPEARPCARGAGEGQRQAVQAVAASAPTARPRCSAGRAAR